ncbi:MAG: SAM domain-containing protein, partial [Promethearchaeia archaeon]
MRRIPCLLAAAGILALLSVCAVAVPSQPPSSLDKVQRWLVELGVDESVRASFAQNKVDVEALALSSKEDLSTLGLTAMGQQIKLLAKAREEQEVQKRHKVASIRTNTYGDSRDKGGLQFCTKDEGSADVDVKAVLSSDGRFGIGVEGEPAAKLHVEGDAIFRTGQCEDIHAQRINASVDVLVQERSVREEMAKKDEQLALLSEKLDNITAATSYLKEELIARPKAGSTEFFDLYWSTHPANYS